MAEETKPQTPAVAAPPRQWTIGVRDDAMAFKPRTWQEIYDFAKLVAATDFCPTDFRDKPGAVLAAWQTGYEVGLPPMAALKYIAVINGRTRIWGNAYWALIQSHPMCESTEELAEHEALEKGYGECTVKRKGRAKPVVARFTKEMAERSGVWGGKGDTEDKKKKSVWYLRPGRMLQWMARNLAGNDAIPEATLGLEIAELAENDPIDVTPKPEPLKIPQPLPEKEKANDGQPDQASEPSIEKNIQRLDESAVHSSVKDSPTESSDRGSDPDASSKPKSKVELCLDRIAGFSAETFPPIGELRVYTDGMSVVHMKIISDAYSAKQKALGLGK